MLAKIKSLLGIGPAADYKEMIKNGAIIIDVRTPGEFQGGHIKNSKNIPLQSLDSQLSKIDKKTPIITCCASGMRSASAKSTLLSNGFKEVHNGGGWSSLRSKL